MGLVMSEAYEAAAEILKQAGWGPHPQWGIYTKGTLVMGLAPSGAFYCKDFAAIPPGSPLYSADTPDSAEEAAAWLVALETREIVYGVQDRPQEHSESDTDGGAAEAASDIIDRGNESVAPRDDGGAKAGPDGRGLALFDVVGQAWPDFSDRDSVYDADYDEAGELSDLSDQAALEFLGEEEQAPRRAARPNQSFSDPARFYGLDDLDRQRSLRIGDVVRISLEMQANIWAASKTSEEEYGAYLNIVMRDTRDGVYQGDPFVYERFTAAQGVKNRVNAVQMHERESVRFLQVADRGQVEAFNPEEGWP